MEPFTIHRSTLVARANEPGLVALYDAAFEAALETPPDQRDAHEPVPGDDSLTWPEGWQEVNTRRLLDSSPRAFWLMARARLIPVSEMEALAMIDREGKTLDRFPAPVANVQRFDASKSKSLMLLRASRRSPRHGNGGTPESAKVISIDDTELEEPDFRKAFGGR